MTEMRDGTPSPLRRFMVRGGSCGAGVLDPDAGAGPSWLPGAYPMRDGRPIVLPRLTSPRAVAGQSGGRYSEPGRRPSRFPGAFRATRPARLLRWKGARRITTTVLRAPADRASSGTNARGGKGGVAGNALHQPRVGTGMSRERRAQGHTSNEKAAVVSGGRE
jgi:hypothetical protein